VIERTRAGGLRTAVAVGLIVLVLIFVVQNSARAPIHLIGFDWTLALGLACASALAEPTCARRGRICGKRRP
jgi:uncharacterized integral membrane protein